MLGFFGFGDCLVDAGGLEGLEFVELGHGFIQISPRLAESGAEQGDDDFRGFGVLGGVGKICPKRYRCPKCVKLENAFVQSCLNFQFSNFMELWGSSCFR